MSADALVDALTAAICREKHAGHDGTGCIYGRVDAELLVRVAREQGLWPVGLTFATLAATNRERCESPDGFRHPLAGWSLSDWFLAAMGELGEAANKAKKLNRVRDGIPGNTETPEELHAGLADELADTLIYLDLLAQAAGIDLAAAVVSKFNRTSEKIGAPHRLVP